MDEAETTMQIEEITVSPTILKVAAFLDRLSLLLRLEPLVLLLVPVIYSVSVFTKGIGFDPDSYYHIGTAGLYASQGWVSSFPWLKFTALGDSFTNVHLGQHLLLAPLTWFFEPLTALKLSVVILSGALVFSIYTVLKRWEIPHPALWALFGAFASQSFIMINSSLKGGTLFFILFVWFLDAVWIRSVRRSFILAWLSVYIYVGAVILIPAAFVFVFMHGLNEKVWEWKLLAAVAVGLLAGYIINPFWAGQWIHTARELTTIFFRPEGVVAGEFFGGEWHSLGGGTLLRWAWLPLALWFVLLVRQLLRSSTTGTAAAAGVVISLGLLAASLIAAKFLQLFIIASLLFLPRMVYAMRPWHKWLAPALVVVAFIAAVFNLNSSYRAIHSPNRIDAKEYRVIAEQLKQITPEKQVVVAPWDDFPGLFLFNRHNNYVAGMNPLFLRWASEKRFNAFVYLYQGKVRDPEKLLPMFFEDAEIILVRRKPRNPGEERLNEQLSLNKYFEEVPSATAIWRIFRLKKHSFEQ